MQTKVIQQSPAHSGYVYVRYKPESSTGKLLFEQVISDSAWDMSREYRRLSDKMLEQLRTDARKKGANVLVVIPPAVEGGGLVGPTFVVEGYLE